jgi:membrane protein implicated in regulation of membrane protease activity
MEVTLEAEVRDGLRDEFAIKNNRFNTLMVCDTVMMGCAFSLVSDGSLPEGSIVQVTWTYMSGLSVSISLLTVSLWCSFIVCRRLNQVTAWALLEMGPSSSHWEEEMNAQRLQKRFDDWFNLHCRAMSVWAERALTGGVIALFVAASALLYARMETELKQGLAPAWMFVGFASATGLFVLFLERRESKLKKRKQGVYRPGKDVSGQRKTSALNEATEDLLRKTIAGLGQEGGPVDNAAASKALLRELSHSAAEQQRAWDAVPSVEEIADQAVRAQASAGTEEWLQKAHELLREGLEGEKEWKRDPNDDLFLIAKQAAAARKLQSHTARTPSPPREELVRDHPSAGRGGGGTSILETVPGKISFALPPTRATAMTSQRNLSTRMMPSANSAGGKAPLTRSMGRSTVDQEGILRMVRWVAVAC